MVEQNQYLDEFLRNSERAKQEIEGSPEILAAIQESLQKPHVWDRGTFSRLVPDRFGLKKRDLDEVMVEVTAMADLYRPDLPISSFAVLYPLPDGNFAYVVEDFGAIPLATHSSPHFPPIREAIAYMKERNYGTESPIPDRMAFSTNLWHNIFLHDGRRRWAMVDFDFSGTLINDFEVYAGAERRIGRFARLQTIWERINSPEYTISPLNK